MSAYNKIINPETGKYISIFSKLGKQTLSNYINAYQYGGSTISEKDLREVIKGSKEMVTPDDRIYSIQKLSEIVEKLKELVDKAPEEREKILNNQIECLNKAIEFLENPENYNSVKGIIPDNILDENFFHGLSSCNSFT